MGGSEKFDTLSTFFNNAFSIFNAKLVFYDIIMYCSFRADEIIKTSARETVDDESKKFRRKAIKLLITNLLIPLN